MYHKDISDYESTLFPLFYYLWISLNWEKNLRYSVLSSRTFGIQFAFSLTNCQTKIDYQVFSANCSIKFGKKTAFMPLFAGRNVTNYPRIWTRVSDSTFRADIRYTTHSSFLKIYYDLTIPTKYILLTV